MEIIKKILKKLKIYDKIKKFYKSKKYLTKKFKFEDRKKDLRKVCFVLAGYKEFLYDVIFERLKKFIPNDIEVCILSSGKYSKKLSEIATLNNWSYLSTKRNNVSLIQNTAINLFNKAEYIYKLDEDIFITKDFFDTLYETHVECTKNGMYKVGFVAPTIPINGFGHVLVLNRFNLVDYYENKYEKILYAAGTDRMIENNANVAKFFWGEGNYIYNIDEMNKMVQQDKKEYIACPIRFSIGAILFTRTFWEKMGMYKVDSTSGMGGDEEQICSYCVSSSQAIIVSKNTIVGHLGFGPQNLIMKEYFLNNKKNFTINN